MGFPVSLFHTTAVSRWLVMQRLYSLSSNFSPLTFNNCRMASIMF